VDSNIKYTLGGIIIHLGFADAGHYYSLIKDRKTNKWFEFNDSDVQEFDINNL
jgi:ubiquitin C-terminal hydrolase